MTERVTLDVDVIQSIEEVRRRHENDDAVFNEIVEGKTREYHAEVLRNYFNGSFSILMKALINGYTQKKTPEEHVRDYYNFLSTEARNTEKPEDQRKSVDDERTGLRMTLKLLGIKIEGVNA